MSDASSPAAPSALTPAQERTLALMRRADGPLVFSEDFIAHLVEEATAAVAELSARLGGETLWVSKSFLARVHGCEVLHLAPDEFSWRPATAAGFVAHKAIELALNWRGEPAPSQVVDEALARLADQPDQRGAFVAGLTDADWAELRSRAVDRCTKFLQDFPPLPLSAHPVLEASAKWKPAGTIELSGKVDLVVGKPAGRESRLLIVDFKSGYRSFHHRDDLRFYALVQTLRQSVPPRKLATYYLDYAESDAEDVTEGTLEAGLSRALAGIEKHIELTAEGRAPVKRVGTACRWCPLQAECPEGRDFLHGDDVVSDDGIDE
ncbi:MAG: PD-(D/E)XK nuclease family protein [Actinomycetota bacterium]|nr:PD-(D/E)XK nuclease family protein [Actinomycetota bacterium]